MQAVTLIDYAFVALVAFFAASCAGISGYGVGLLMPLVLVPIVGPTKTLPIIAAAAIVTNASRLAAFRIHFDRRYALLLLLCATPGTLLSAWLYTHLDSRGAALVIGCAMLVLVPGRRFLARRKIALRRPAIAAAGLGFGLVNGAAPGTGVVLISILLAAGLTGQAVVATDAGISMLLGLGKVAVFAGAGALDPADWLMAAVIGAASLPAAFFARWLLTRLTARVHLGILDAVVLVGAILLIRRGLA